MKILVFVKHVPDTETRMKIAGGGSTGSALDESDFQYMVNPYDEFAIEEAVVTKPKISAATELVAVSMGPERCQEALRKAMAMGADSGVWIRTDGLGPNDLDSLMVAKALAAVAKQEDAGLIFTGQKAIDDDCGHIGPMVAELLGMPHVQVVTGLEIQDGGVKAKVSREVEGGMVEEYEVQLPAVLGAHKSLNQPRFPSLPGIMKAKKKPLREVQASELIGGTAASTVITGYALPPEKQPGKVFKDKPVADMVKEVVSLLREEAKAI